MNPLVSIIIPIYNMEEFISECLESIVSQSLKQIEILCIDDCSTDNSKEKVFQYIQKDKRIQYFKLKRNSGSGIARNYGIHKAKGTYLAFMDPDDYYYDNFALEHLYTLALEKNVNAAAGNLMMYDNLSQEEIALPHMHFKTNSFMDLSQYLFHGAYHRFIYKTKIIKENNIVFPPYRRRQDPCFFYQTMLKMGKFYTTTQNIYMYRFSHKIVPWNEVQISDALKSYVDNMKLLLEHKLYEHYRIEINDFKQKFLMNKSLNIDSNIQKQLDSILSSIQYKYLKKSVPQCLKPHEAKALNTFMLKNNLLNKNISCIIYGFGNVGNAVYESIKKKCNILGIIDQTFLNLVVDSHRITNSIKDLNYLNSKIIITILNKDIQKELIKNLQNRYGIKRHNIILC
ncbi:MAG: glycosyltransferase family 2 protein [Arcobacteraceae bacterium]